MEIRQLEPFEIDEAITLIWETFLQFEKKISTRALTWLITSAILLLEHENK